MPQVAVFKNVEIKHEVPLRFFFDQRSFRLDLYRLITCFYSSITFAEYGEDYDYDRVRELQQEYEESEIVRLLVNIAVMARIVDDRNEPFPEQFRIQCGKLIVDLSEPTKLEPLSLREACNKIIHAKEFNWDIEQLKNEDDLPYPTTRYLAPRIYLYGAHGTNNWKAILEVSKFVRLSASLQV